MKRLVPLLALLLTTLTPPLMAADVTLELRYQTQTSDGSGRYHRLTRQEQWKPSETAVIMCDVWDLHHCLNAVRRVEEFAPRLNKVIEQARSQGMTIIHSPSDCMPHYADHTARRRALEVPPAANLPKDITSWCSQIPAEEQGVYPIDQSDGGEDDDPAEHAAWAKKLADMGRNPNLPWQQQSDLIKIDSQRDYITDQGDQVWSILEARGIKNVILTGVHTNMCVLGRPFGLRQMARNGKNVVLMRDMTDTMYNPQRWPYVSHFTGTDLIVSHVEKFVCPTITSDQLIGGQTFRFAGDKRPHVAMVIAESEYETARTLPEFAGKYLGKQFRVSYVFANEEDPNDLPGLEVLEQADLALISVRRRPLPAEQMALLKKFVAAGKPVVGIRTASHAFSLRGKPPEQPLVQWAEFDAQVFGGNYSNHYGNKLEATVSLVNEATDHPILTGIDSKSFPKGGSLYKPSPLASGTTTLLTGKVEGQPAEPVAWTFTRADGGRSFYTSLGHVEDFQRPEFIRLLVNGTCWAADVPVPQQVTIATRREDLSRHWSTIAVPSSWEAATAGVLKNYEGVAWYRCAVRLPTQWIANHEVRLQLPGDAETQAWLNGQPLTKHAAGYPLESEWLHADDANLLVVRFAKQTGERGWLTAPILTAGNSRLKLAGQWQFRTGDDPAWSNMPLPAKFGASADVVFTPAR